MATLVTMFVVLVLVVAIARWLRTPR